MAPWQCPPTGDCPTLPGAALAPGFPPTSKPSNGGENGTVPLDAPGAPNPWADQADEQYDTIWGIHPDDVAGTAFATAHDRIWFRGEFLAWWSKGFAVPALLTTSPAGTDVTQAGVLGAATTTVLLGKEDLNGGFRPGERLVLGTWLGHTQTWGIEASYLQLNPQSSVYQVSGNNVPILARPFFNVENNVQDTQIVSYPGQESGSFASLATSQMQAVEVLFRRNLTRRGDADIDLTAGYRYQQLNDHLTLDDTITFSSGQTAFPPGSVVAQSDRFETRNVFDGGEIGLTASIRRERWTFDSSLKVGIGETASHVTILGMTTTTIPGQGRSDELGGFLALPSNLGVYDRYRFSVVPELGLTLGWDFTSQLRGTIGYDLLYWTGVARPGDQIDLNLDPRQFPPPVTSTATRPQFVLHTSDYWAQGVNLGLDWRF